MSKRNGWRSGAWPYHGESEEDFMKRISAGPKKKAVASAPTKKRSKNPITVIQNGRLTADGAALLRRLPKSVRNIMYRGCEHRYSDGQVVQVRNGSMIRTM